ncbi:MAG: hypothetical protein J7L41_02570 [Synergistetes bacterium]|nr:hypothetical protein [Synergistota bacterium]
MRISRYIIGMIMISLVMIVLSGCGGGGGLTWDFGDNDPNKYLAFGDSITEGCPYGPSGGYPVRLQALLGDGAVVVNAGVGGEKTPEGVRRYESVLHNNKPGFVLILEGSNDATHFPKDVDETINNLKFMVEKAKENATIPIIGTIPPMFGMHKWWELDVETRDARIRELAQEEDIVLADIFEAMKGREDLFIWDGLHPNEDGYQLMAQVWYDAIQEAKRKYNVE